MRAAGFIVFGEARLDEKVPPLLSRSRGVRAEVTVEADVEADETLEADDVADEPDTDA
jgi:hypothetical protein